jgi:hypothetical protein
VIRSAVLEHDVCYLMSRRMDREYLTYQRPPIACHSMRLGGRHHIHEPRAFGWRRVFEHNSGQYKTRSRARRAIAD